MRRGAGFRTGTRLVCAVVAAALAASLALPFRLAIVAGVLATLLFVFGGIRRDDLNFLWTILRREPGAAANSGGL